MAYTGNGSPRYRKGGVRGKVQTTDFDKALLDIMSRSMDGSDFQLWRLKVTLGKNLPQLLSLYPLSQMTYSRAFQYKERGEEGENIKDLSNEIGSALRYIVSIHSVYKDLKREAEMGALEKIALDRITATEKTKDRKDMVNSGRTGDDDEKDDGSNAGLLGYVEGDIAGITPEMSDLMAQLENTFRILSGMDINEAENLIGKGDLKLGPESGLHAVSEETEYTAKDLADITGTLVRLRESLPYLDEEFAGKRLAKDTNLRADLSRITTVLNDNLRYNPYYTASELVDMIGGPGSMAALEGEQSEAAMTRILGSIADPSAAGNVISSIKASIEKTPTVFVNRYSGNGKDDVAGFFSKDGTAYNVRGRKSARTNAKAAEVAAIKEEYDAIPDHGSESARNAFDRGRQAATELQKNILFDSMNGIQQIIYNENTNPAIVEKTSDFLISTYGYMKEGMSGYYLGEDAERYIARAVETIRDSVDSITDRIGMERMVDYMEELPTAAEFSSFIARMEGVAYRTGLENNRDYLDVFDEYYRLYRRSIDSQNAQIGAAKTIADPEGFIGTALKSENLKEILDAHDGISPSDITVSVDEKKLIEEGLSFSVAEEGSPNPLNDAVMLYHESERRMRALGQLRNIKDLGSIDLPGSDGLEALKNEARKDRDNRRERLIALIGSERGEELSEDIASRFASAISITGVGINLDAGVADEIRNAIASEYAAVYSKLCDEIDSYHSLTGEIISNSETLRERNIDHLAEEYGRIAADKGLEISPEDLRNTVSIAVNSVWNRRKTAAAISKAVDTFNQYAVRGLFDDRKDKVDYTSEETISAFRHGAATFVSMKDVSRFVLDTMPKQIEGLQELYNANISSRALTPERDKAFHDAHEQLVFERRSELEKDVKRLSDSIRREENILGSTFSGEIQYNLGIELRDMLESADINSLRSIDGRLEERKALKDEVVKAYEDMRDTLHAMMIDAPVRDPLTGEEKPGEHPDLDNRIFNVDEIARFLIKGQLEREEPGSYTYSGRDVDWRFFNRMIEASRNDIRDRVAEWDRDGSLINPEEYTPRCITAYLDARKRYDALLSEIGTDARFEEFRTKSMAFIRNNPLDPYSRAASRYISAVHSGADDASLAQLYSDVVKASSEAPYMGKEAKLLHETNPEATREDLIATGEEFMSDRDSLYQRLRSDRDELSRMNEELGFLSSSADPLFVIAGAAVPDYSQETEIVRDDIATAHLLQNISAAMRESTDAASRGLSRALGMDWKAYRRELNPYYQALIARLGGKALDTQLDMFSQSLLAGPIPEPHVLGEEMDEDGYWHAVTDISDPVFSDSFDVIRNYVISINDGVLLNGNRITDGFREAMEAARSSRSDGILGVRNAFLSEYAAAVTEKGGGLSKNELNGMFRKHHEAYISYVKGVSERFAYVRMPFAEYFTRGSDGKNAYADRSAFRRMVASDERFRETRPNGTRAPSLGRLLAISTLPRTIVSPVRRPFLVKDLGTGAEAEPQDRSGRQTASYSPDAILSSKGSDFYGINTKNLVMPGSNQQYYGLLFRTFGKGSISKEAVLAMLAMKTGAVEEERVSSIRTDYESRMAAAQNPERRKSLESAMNKAMEDVRKTMSYVRADLDPTKWDAVVPPGITDGRSGIVMLVPNSPLRGVQTADFIRRNALYVTEGRIDVRSGISLDGIEGMRRFLKSRMSNLEASITAPEMTGPDGALVKAAVESYRKELDALDSLERLEKSEDGKGILADREAINRFITEEIDGRSSEFIASFDEYGREAAVQKAVAARNDEYDTERSAILNEVDRLESGREGARFNPLGGHGNGPRKAEGTGRDDEGLDMDADKGFLSADSFLRTRTSADRRIDDMTQFDAGEAVDGILPDKKRVPRTIKGVKDVFDIAFKPIDGRGTPLYRDPEKFGFLLSFIRDNFRSETAQSFCMTGGTLLDESFVAMADSINLYEAIANGEGENEITYLVYRKMFEAANVDLTLNSRDVVQLEDDGEDIRTDDAIDMSEREESGARMEGGEIVQRSVELEHFAALEPELSEYGMNQERDNVQRTFAYQAELRNSMPDNAPGSIYGKLGMKGIGKFTEFFSLMERELSGTITDEGRRKLESMLPKEILSLGSPMDDVTADQVRGWFKAWNEDEMDELMEAAPASVPLDRKLFVIQSLLPMAGIDRVKEGSAAQRNTALKVASLMVRTEMPDDSISWDMLKAFHRSVSYVGIGKDGLPDYRDVDIDSESLDETTRKALSPIIGNPSYCAELCRILSTSGMEEDVIPENMGSVIDLLAADAERPVSLERYSKFFRDAFADQLKDYRDRRALMRLFDDEANAELLATRLHDFMASSKAHTLTELKEEASRIITEIVGDEMKADIRISAVPEEKDRPGDLAARIEKDILKAVEEKGAGMEKETAAVVGRMIAESFEKDSKRLADIVSSYISGMKEEADRKGERLRISPTALGDCIRQGMGTSMLSRDTFVEKPLVNGIVRALAEASRDGRYQMSESGRDRETVLAEVRKELAKDGYMDRAFRSFGSSRLAADSIPEVSAALKIEGEKWVELVDELAWVKDSKADAFQRIMERMNESPDALVRTTFGLKADFEDSIRRYAAMTKVPRSFYLDPTTISSLSMRAGDAIANAKGKKTHGSVASLLIPYALIPTHGFVDKVSGQWRFDRFVPVYSEKRAEELYGILSRYSHSDTAAAVLAEARKRSQDMRESLRNADTPEKLRAELMRILGKAEMERRLDTIRFFSSLDAAELTLLPDRADMIPRSFDGSRIDPDYASKVHAEAQLEKLVQKPKTEKAAEEHDKEPEKIPETGLAADSHEEELTIDSATGKDEPAVPQHETTAMRMKRKAEKKAMLENGISKDPKKKG